MKDFEKLAEETIEKNKDVLQRLKDHDEGKIKIETSKVEALVKKQELNMKNKDIKEKSAIDHAKYQRDLSAKHDFMFYLGEFGKICEDMGCNSHHAISSRDDILGKIILDRETHTQQEREKAVLNNTFKAIGVVQDIFHEDYDIEPREFEYQFKVRINQVIKDNK